MNQATIALVIGAGPAGLTAAFELLRRTNVRPVVLEMSDYVGGISRTVRYRGNRIDIGGHRFFSKSERIMQWWMDLMPPEVTPQTAHLLSHPSNAASPRSDSQAPDPRTQDRVMLICQRKSRIYFLRQLFDYPVTLSADTVKKLGLLRACQIGISYMWAMARQIRPEQTLEQFLINRFGRQLYLTFFKSYTEKVWGVPCAQIPAEWGAQRIKGLSLGKAVTFFLKKALGFTQRAGIKQRQTETSLIERFLYPKYGPGQLWECVAETVRGQGGEVLTGWKVNALEIEHDRVTAAEAVHENGERRRFTAEWFFSSMPVQELVRAMKTEVPPAVLEVSEGLVYRDFITVGLLLDRLALQEDSADGDKLLKDNWVYIQEPDVLVGRMQIFNNWSPYMVADPGKVWVGLEYFCSEGDGLWSRRDAEMIALAVEEMERLGIIRKADVRDATVIRVPKAYPAYFGTYGRFDEIRRFVDRFENLFLVGRNGMHRYNNQDHSMLTAMTAVDNIVTGRTDKSNVWAVNTERQYHETSDETKEVVA